MIISLILQMHFPWPEIFDRALPSSGTSGLLYGGPGLVFPAPPRGPSADASSGWEHRTLSGEVISEERRETADRVS